MHGKNPAHTCHSMVYFSVLVALVARRRWRSGRVKGMPIVRVLRRVWLPPVVLTVTGSAGFAVSLVRAVFAPEKHPSAADSQVADTEPLHPESGIYEVFGPAVTVADMSYFDGESEPQVDGGRESFQRRERLHTLTG
jgi:Mycobacterium membrane protein